MHPRWLFGISSINSSTAKWMVGRRSLVDVFPFPWAMLVFWRMVNGEGLFLRAYRRSRDFWGPTEDPETFGGQRSRSLSTVKAQSESWCP